MWTMEERIWIKIVYLLLFHNSKTLITSLYKIPASSSVESHSVLRTVTQMANKRSFPECYLPNRILLRFTLDL